LTGQQPGLNGGGAVKGLAESEDCLHHVRRRTSLLTQAPFRNLKGWLLPNDSVDYKSRIKQEAVLQVRCGGRTFLARILLIFGAFSRATTKRTKSTPFIEKRDLWKH
jgi:hypothetical protein